MAPSAFAGLLAELPTPMALTRVALADGSEVTGFACEPSAVEGAREITAAGGWRDWLATRGGDRELTMRTCD